VSDIPLKNIYWLILFRRGIVVCHLLFWHLFSTTFYNCHSASDDELNMALLCILIMLNSFSLIDYTNFNIKSLFLFAILVCCVSKHCYLMYRISLIRYCSAIMFQNSRCSGKETSHTSGWSSSWRATASSGCCSWPPKSGEVHISSMFGQELCSSEGCWHQRPSNCCFRYGMKPRYLGFIKLN